MLDRPQRPPTPAAHQRRYKARHRQQQIAVTTGFRPDETAILPPA
jgi:hypothetical protein